MIISPKDRTADQSDHQDPLKLLEVAEKVVARYERPSKLRNRSFIFHEYTVCSSDRLITSPNIPRLCPAAIVRTVSKTINYAHMFTSLIKVQYRFMCVLCGI